MLIKKIYLEYENEIPILKLELYETSIIFKKTFIKYKNNFELKASKYNILLEQINFLILNYMRYIRITEIKNDLDIGHICTISILNDDEPWNKNLIELYEIKN
jgi:hypothetical protein